MGSHHRSVHFLLLSPICETYISALNMRDWLPVQRLLRNLPEISLRAADGSLLLNRKWFQIGQPSELWSAAVAGVTVLDVNENIL